MLPKLQAQIHHPRLAELRDPIGTPLRLFGHYSIMLISRWNTGQMLFFILHSSGTSQPMKVFLSLHTSYGLIGAPTLLVFVFLAVPSMLVDQAPDQTNCRITSEKVFSLATLPLGIISGLLI
jgi:hypothetical protein